MKRLDISFYLIWGLSLHGMQNSFVYFAVRLLLRKRETFTQPQTIHTAPWSLLH